MTSLQPISPKSDDSTNPPPRKRKKDDGGEDKDGKNVDASIDDDLFGRGRFGCGRFGRGGGGAASDGHRDREGNQTGTNAHRNTPAGTLVEMSGPPVAVVAPRCRRRQEKNAFRGLLWGQQSANSLVFVYASTIRRH